MRTCYPKIENWMVEFPVELINDMYEKSQKIYGEPTRATNQMSIEYSELYKILSSHNLKEMEVLVDSIMQGYMIFVKNVLSPEQISQINKIFLKLQSDQPSSFHKIYDGVPNFWRNITEEFSKNYAVPVVKKTSYWFPWNAGSEKIYELIMPIYRAFKALGGRSPIEYESNIPSTGKVDRIQIVHYPAKSGKLDAHHDPKEGQRLIMSGYMTQKGRDFNGGGFWALGADGNKMDMESYISAGDFGTCYAEIIHGVDATDLGDRGFIGMYSIDSDYIQNRDTTRVVKNSNDA